VPGDAARQFRCAADARASTHVTITKLQEISMNIRIIAMATTLALRGLTASALADNDGLWG